MFSRPLPRTDEVSALNDTLGAMFVGVIVSAVLYGMICTQAIYYYTHYATDPKKLKFLVAVNILLDTLHLAMISQATYYYLISNYYNPGALEYVTWTLVWETLCTCINGAAVQCFFTLSVWRLSLKNIWITIPILLLVIGDISISLVWIGAASTRNTFTQLLQIKQITMAITVLTAAADVLIAASLCILLRRSRTGYKRTDGIINKLTLFVINSGLLTSLCAVGSLIFLIILPDSDVYATFYFCIGRLYTNSLLATLNARRGLRAHTSSAEQELAFSSGRSNLSGGAIPRTTTSQQRTRVSDMPVRIDNIHEFHTHDSSSTPDLPKTDYQRDFHT